jgi:N-carbamoylputrescine amidase
MNVGVVQLECHDGQTTRNLEHARVVIEEHFKTDTRTKLLLLPELLSAGYDLSENVWLCAESSGDNSPTITFIKSVAIKYQIVVGATYVEADTTDNHIYNTFVLMGPLGNVLGRVRKSRPASFERNYFNEYNSTHVIEIPTSFLNPSADASQKLRVGVAICYENMLHDTIKEFVNKDSLCTIDILLSPFSAPLPVPNPVTFPQVHCEAYIEQLHKIAQTLSKTLHIPVIYCNKTGPWSSILTIFGSKQTIVSQFPGGCTISDQDGNIVSQFTPNKLEEGVLVGHVEMPTQRKRVILERYFGGYIVPMPWPVQMFWVMEKIGLIHYHKPSTTERRTNAINKLRGFPESYPHSLLKRYVFVSSAIIASLWYTNK